MIYHETMSYMIHIINERATLSKEKGRQKIFL